MRSRHRVASDETGRRAGGPRSDPGFGSRISESSRARLLNRDGSFNVRRHGVSFLQSLHLYQTALTMSWARFMVAVLVVFVGTNVIFAIGFFAAGPHALSGTHATNTMSRFVEDFFFSIQAFTTVGFGQLSPQSFAANILSALDAFVGLLAFALATGLLFARFSRPTAKLIFSHKAIVAPYKGITGFEFRLANARKSNLVEVEASILFTWVEGGDETGGLSNRKFRSLPLEIDRISFLTTHWTVVHPITEDSPLYGWSADDFVSSSAEFMVTISGIDDTFSERVFSRTSYTPAEIEHGASFVDMFIQFDSEAAHFDMSKLHSYVPAQLPMRQLERGETAE
ncbi:MAG: hypothetical protein KDD65_16980 [Bacteroidetes bacterium]|nr:hypothetical protein [Bacteroidota bacterium]